MRILSVAALLALGVGLSAEERVATLTSSGTFELRGVATSPVGVPSWPVMAGDEIKTLSDAAMLLFPDGSRVTLEAGSQARIEGGSAVTLKLMSGGMQFALVASSKVKLVNRGVPLLEKTGSIGRSGVSPAAQLRPPAPPPPPGPVSSR